MRQTFDCTTIDLDSIPSPPGVAVKLLELFRNDEVEVDELEKVIGADIALTAKILSYCNSPMFGRTVQINSLGHAIVTIGFRKIRTIALSFSLIGKNTESDIDFENFWNRSLATAAGAQAVSLYAGENDEIAFLVGLVMNVGELAILANFSENEIPDIAIGERVALVADEDKKTFGIDRFKLGCQILEQWGFPNTIILHLEQLIGEENPCRLSRCVDLGYQIASLFFCERVTQNKLVNIDEFGSELLGEGFLLAEAFDKAFLSWTELSRLLESDCNSQNCLRKLELDARKRLVSYSLTQADENQKIQLENESLSLQAQTDELTGLYNRRCLETILDIEYERALRGSFLSIAFIDIDFFKRINDIHGHLIGDEVLKHIATHLEANVRKSDVVCRYGGEEFVVLMADRKPTSAIVVAERIRMKIAATPYLAHNDLPIPITVSIGIATMGKDDSFGSSKEFLQLADQNLYSAKKQGRNRCVSDSKPC